MSTDPKIILLADDDEDDQELLKEAFLRNEPNAEIHTASMGKDVMEYLLNCPGNKLPCLIVLDYNMPDFTGAQVLELLCKNPRFQHIPAVIWSTSNAFLYQEICKKNGAKEYFHKPDRFEDVIAMSQKMLGHC